MRLFYFAVEKREIEAKKQKHCDEQETERKEYYFRKHMAKSFSDKYLTIIIDGMDSNKLCLPRIRRPSTALDTRGILKFNLMGVRVQGAVPSAHMYLNTGRFARDVGVPFQALLDTLVSLKQR